MVLTQYKCILLEKVGKYEVTLAIAAQNHVGCGNREHQIVAFSAIKVIPLDIKFQLLSLIAQNIGPAVNLTQHSVHGSDAKTCRAAGRVEYYVLRFHIHQICHELCNMCGCQDNAKTLTIATGIRQKFTIEPSQDIISDIVDDGCQNF